MAVGVLLVVPGAAVGEVDWRGRGILVPLWLAHLARRLGECLALHVWSDATMHVAVLAFGLAHYVGANVTLAAALAGGECAEPARLLPPASLDTLPGAVLYGTGVAAVVVGQVAQHLAHAQLAALRRGRTGYALPSGGLFTLSSSPHYTAEVLIYGGLLLLAGSAAAGALAVWVAVNLSLSALATSAWYRRTFGRTPSQWAIFPHLL